MLKHVWLCTGKADRRRKGKVRYNLSLNTAADALAESVCRDFSDSDARIRLEAGSAVAMVTLCADEIASGSTPFDKAEVMQLHFWRDAINIFPNEHADSPELAFYTFYIRDVWMLDDPIDTGIAGMTARTRTFFRKTPRNLQNCPARVWLSDRGRRAQSHV
eukprot:5034321-Amphidinium_carterae.1